MVYSLFTIMTSGSTKYTSSAVSGGLHAIFTSEWFILHRYRVAGLMYFLAFFILVIFSITVQFATRDEKMGLVVSILTIYTDVVIIFYLHAGLSDGPFEGTLIALISRFFLVVFSFSEEHWFIGYCIIYVALALIMFDDILDIHIPLIIKVTEAKTSDTSPAIEIKNTSEWVKKEDITKTAEWVLFLATVLFIVTTLVIYTGNPSGVAVTVFGYPIWLILIFTLVLTVTIFMLMTTYRIWVRKKRSMNGSVLYYFRCECMDPYWMLILLSGVSIMISGIMLWAATDSYDILILGIFLPFILAFGLTSYTNYVLNNYSVLMNIAEHNNRRAKLKKHEEKIL